MKLRTHLFFLVIAALVPALIFSCVLIFQSYRQQRSDIERGMIGTARALSLAVDRELEAAIRTLSAIAASEHLTSNNLRQFYNYAQNAIKVSRGWEGVALIDRAGQQVLNLRRPFGTKLPRAALPDLMRQVFETGKPGVSGLYRSPTTGTFLFVVAVPVVRNGATRYVLASAASPAFLATLLSQQKIPPQWTGTILDQNKIIIARTRETDNLVGQPATPRFATESAQAEEGWFWGATKENIPVYAAFSRSRLSGWTVGLGIPAAEVEAPLRRSLMATGIVGIVVLLGGIFVATMIGYRLSRSTARLSAGAQAMGKGEAFRIETLPVVELDRVAREIEMAAVNRNEMDAALRQSEGRLKTIIETEPECVKIVAPDGRLLDMNPAGLAMLEAASPEEVKTCPLLEFIAPEYRAAFGDLHKRVMEGESGTLEFEVIGLKGTRRWLYTHAVPLRDEQGKPAALLGITRDITARKNAEEEIRRNLQRIEALRAIEQAVTSSLDLQSILQVLLQKIELFLPIAAVTTVRLLNRGTGRFEFLACRGVDEKEWNAGRKGVKARKIVETRAPLQVLNVVTDPLTFTQGVFLKYGLVSYLGVPLIVRDEVLGVLGLYTKQEHVFTREEIEFLTTLASQAAVAIRNAQLYEEVVKANKVKEEFLSVMSHELRTPLSVVTGYVGMVKDGLLGEINPQQQDALQKVLARADEQLGLINDIMQTTMLEVSTPAVERQPVDLGELFDDLKDAYHFSASKKNLKLVWDCPPSLPAIVTDGAKLRQILQNLIGNAIKFTDAGGVTVSARLVPSAPMLPGPPAGERWLELRVTDTGAGMPPDKLHLIFDKFYQLDSSETRIYGGVGLGLYIVKHFTELLGGKVAVESTPGKGSTFTVTIPSAS
jgi:PAS domain S-box-containing protein